MSVLTECCPQRFKIAQSTEVIALDPILSFSSQTAHTDGVMADPASKRLRLHSAKASIPANVEMVRRTNAADQDVRSSSRSLSSVDVVTDRTAVGRATQGQKNDTESIWYHNSQGLAQFIRALIFPANWANPEKRQFATEMVANGFHGVCRNLGVSHDKKSGKFYAAGGQYLENKRVGNNAFKAYLIPRIFFNTTVGGNDRGPGNPDGDLRITVNGAVTALQKHLSLAASEKEAAVKDNVAAWKDRLK